ncbi:MAG: sugar ABC transporter permease [Acidimicrobiia bacterium]|nr:sugar ABC transporter permease [Acidimicrobiia bacterium]
MATDLKQKDPEQTWWQTNQAGIYRGTGAIAGAAAVVIVLRWALGFLRDLDAPARTIAGIYEFFGADQSADAIRASGLSSASNKAIIAVVALVVGVAGVWALFLAANALVDRLAFSWRSRIRPWVFVGPAIALLGFFLVFPTLNTVYTSLTEDIADFPTEVPAELTASDDILATMAGEEDRVEFGSYWINGDSFEIAKVTVISSKEGNSSAILILSGGKVRTFGLQNYGFALTDEDMRIAFRNNLLWLVIGTGGAVILGLLIATLVDRVKREALAKTFVFVPLSISMVGAAVIWRFMYYWRPPGQTQIGLLNAVKTGLGGEPTAWVQTPPLNTMALIVIMVWLQTGFAMVILSAALKGVPNEIVEAARIDGANEFQLFFRVIVPSIRGSIITVSTTVFIAILKVFDIVFVMTGGRFDTEVVANRMFTEMFKFRNFGRASSLAVILLVVTIPIMVINIRNLRRQGIGA